MLVVSHRNHHFDHSKREKIADSGTVMLEN
jgi:hypothetical protein